MVPFLAEFLDGSGYGVRLDRLYGMHMKDPGEGAPAGRAANGRQYPMGLHQGVTPYIPAETYRFVHGKPQCSFLVFTWALTASGGDQGGFAVVPVRPLPLNPVSSLPHPAAIPRV